MNKLSLITAFLLLLIGGVAVVGATEIHITTVAGLQAIQTDLGGTYVLDNDLDLADSVFTPLGHDGDPFTGTFDGKDHTIANFVLYPRQVTGQGLFGCSDGTIRNLKLQNSRLTPDGDTNYIGSLVGWNTLAGTVSNITVQDVVVQGGADVGSIVGRNDGSITNCSAVNATVTNPYAGGGITGTNRGSIHDCTVLSSNISCGSDGGGITGVSEQDIIESQLRQPVVDNCHVRSTTVTGHGPIGGLIGAINADFRAGVTLSNSTVEDSTIRGIPGISCSEDIGGGVGYVMGGRVGNCGVLRTIVEGDRDVGGFAGESGDGQITDSTASATVTSTGRGQSYGGFIGRNEGMVNQCSASGPTNDKNVGTMTGGFVGANMQPGIINSCTASGAVSGNNRVGGFGGYNQGGATIADSSASGTVVGVSEIGAFIGVNNGLIRNCSIVPLTQTRQSARPDRQQSMQVQTHSNYAMKLTSTLLYDQAREDACDAVLAGSVPVDEFVRMVDDEVILTTPQQAGPMASSALIFPIKTPDAFTHHNCGTGKIESKP